MLTRTIVIGFSSCGPAWLAWDWMSPKGVLIGFLAALVAFSCGWYVSRRFVREMAG